MDKEKLIQRISFHNPWWQTGRVPESLLPPFQRDMFTTLKRYLSLDRIIVFKGPRRVGKSTLLYQLIDHLIHEGINPKRLLYLTFDDPLLRGDLLDILAVFEQTNNLSLEGPQATFVFLDEAQFLPEWASEIKLLFDRKLPLKLVVSGSSASLLIKQSESLAGRTIEETLLPFTFAEWQTYHQTQTSTLLSTKGEILFQSYMGKSGFPHLFPIEDPVLWPRMLTEDIITKAIYKDAVELYGLREPAVLEKLFSYLASATGGLANHVKLASMLGIDRVAVARYLTFLYNSLLVFPLPKYSRQIRETIRSQEKIHLIDQGFTHVFASSPGARLESIVARHVWEVFPKTTYFWRDREEVDIVLEREKGKSLLPIEVKLQQRVSKEDIPGLLKFCNAFGLSEGIVVYMGEKKKRTIAGIDITSFPAWEFLGSIKTIL